MYIKSVKCISLQLFILPNLDISIVVEMELLTLSPYNSTNAKVRYCLITVLIRSFPQNHIYKPADIMNIQGVDYYCGFFSKNLKYILDQVLDSRQRAVCQYKTNNDVTSYFLILTSNFHVLFLESSTDWKPFGIITNALISAWKCNLAALQEIMKT